MIYHHRRFDGRQTVPVIRLPDIVCVQSLRNGIPVNPHIRKQCRRVIDGHRLKGLVANVFFCNHIY